MPKTFKITITGQVQGVGFRPTVYGLAKRQHLKGEVFNNEYGVVIHLNASQDEVAVFMEELLKNRPVSSIIKSHQIETITSKNFDDFNIVPSEKQHQINLPLTPDFAICKDCKSELEDSQNRRYHYAFTTCINCGPRYAVTTKFPFERENTSINAFKMCAECQEEYTNPSNRRFHSQTNSCPTCGITMELTNAIGISMDYNPSKIIEKTSQLISEGYIIAIKNTNGYLLCCDANNPTTILRLREKKHRPSKPFALLYPNLELVKSQFDINKAEAETMTSSVAPIVIFPFEKNIQNLATNEIAPNLKQLGVMLPSSALLQLLMTSHKIPIIATSGNLHGSAIVSTKSEAQKELKSVADYFMHHNLDIQFPQDDSVVKFSNEHQILLRRSRGLAPNYLDFTYRKTEKILAMGAHLKSTFAFVPNQQLYVSQYFGNLDSYSVSQRYEETIHRYVELFDSKPNIILTDKHPNYQSSILGKELAQKWNAKCIEVQHHKAHFASVLGDHHLFDSDEKIFGVIWDGTGLGDDQMIWGGEFFSYENHQMKRLSHFEYFDWIAADKMAEEPRLSLLSLISEEEKAKIKSKFSDSEWRIYNKLLQSNSLKTSSVGRLFDAMASLLGLMDKVTFEGEAAMLLEQCANDYSFDDYEDFLNNEAYEKMPSKLLIQKAFNFLNEGHSKEFVAASFIHTLAKFIIREATKNHFKIIACSGGVFQNAFLLDQLESLTKNSDIKLKINRKLCSNDENISFGQLLYYLNIETHNS